MLKQPIPAVEAPPALSPEIPKETANTAAVLGFRDLVRERLAREPYPPGYVVSTRWQHMIDRALDDVASMDAKQIALRGLASGDFDVGLPPADVKHVQNMRAKHVAAHPELANISESSLAPPGSTATCEGGITFSHGLEQMFDFYDHIVSGIGSQHMPYVVEIGSGSGRLARVLRLAGRGQHFTLIDLPQSLVFSFAFLRLHFPDERLKVIGSRADIYPGMERDFDFVFCPVQFLDALRPETVDLVVNTYSLGEMQQGCVDHLMRFIHSTLRPRYFFSLNSIFIDKNLHFAESGRTGEGNEIVLKLEATWWPHTFRLHKSLENGSWRSEVATVLERVSLPEDQLVADLIAAAAEHKTGSDMWLGLMYMAAMGALDTTVIDDFLDGLRARHVADGIDQSPHYRFDTIGEVQFLRRRSAAILCCADLNRRERHPAPWSIGQCGISGNS